MNRLSRGLSALTTLVALGACNSLDISNPNAPNAQTALSDPTALEAVGSGSIRTFLNAYNTLRGAAAMSAMARSYSSSWNNGNLNFYSSVDIAPNDESTAPDTWTRNGRPWQNNPSAAGRTSMESFWSGGVDEQKVLHPGVYASYAAANDALKAIRTGHKVIRTAAETKRLETIAVLMQGASLMTIALNYDKGYYVSENTDPLVPLEFKDRKELRDSAVKRLQEAAALATANSFTTPASWFNGESYTNAQIAQIANTMAAMTLTWYARDDAENSATDWAAVASFAANGMSSGTPVDLVYRLDGCTAWCNEQLYWFTIDEGRVSTRVAHFLDPVAFPDPYNLSTGGGTPPNSPDARLGDGSYGDDTMEDGFGNIPKDAGAGTDFAYSFFGEVFRPDRGFYHQTNLGHIRYDITGNVGPDGIYGAQGPTPAITATINDLLWAEALIRQGGAANLLAAAQLVDRTRVGRGNLSSSVAAVGNVGGPNDGPCMSDGRLAKNGGACTLWSMLLYENELELLGLGPAAYWNQRHLPVVIGGGAFDNSRSRYIQGLLPGTPREMPVPAKELGVQGLALYTWGGQGAANSTAP